MKLYQTLARIRAKGEEDRLASPFKHVKAAMLLSKHEKWNQSFSGTSGQVEGYRAEEQDVRSEALPVESEPQTNLGKREVNYELTSVEDDRPCGVKKRKKVLKEEGMIHNAMSSGLDAAQKASERCLKVVTGGMKALQRLVLLNHMQHGPAKNRMVEKLVEKLEGSDEEEEESEASD